jgi:hypothetical protein
MGYLDPGLFGILSQVGLGIFLLAVSAFAFFFRPIKKFFARLFKGKKLDQPESAANDEQPPQ